MLTHQTIDPNAPSKKPFVLLRPFIALWHWLLPPSQAHADRQSRSQRFAAIAVVTLVCLAAAGFAVFYAKPIQDAYQDWKANRLVKQARSLVDQGEIYQAVMKADEAYRIAPENVEAIRINGEFYSRMNRPEAIYFLEKLQKMEVATTADLQLLVRALSAADREKEAQELLEKLISERAVSDSTLLLARQTFGKDVYVFNMLPKLKEYVKEHPDDYRNRFRLAQMQVESNIPSETRAGVAELWELAALDKAEGLEALEYLSRFDNLPPDESLRLIDRLQNHPRATPAHGVLALRRKLKMYPEKRNAIFLEGIEKYGEKERGELLPLVRWMVEEREFQRVLSLLPEDQAVTYQPLLENYLTSLTMLSRMKDLERLIEDPRVDMLLTPAMSAFYRMHLAYVTGKPPAELRERMEQALKRATTEAQEKLLLSIGTYGEKRGIVDIAEKAYEIVSQSRAPAMRMQGLEGYLRTSRANGNTEGFLNAIREAAKLMPDNQSYLEQLVYVNLLTGRDIELSLRNAEDLLKKRPNDSFRKLLVSLAWWRLNYPSQAAENLKRIDVTNLQPGQLATIAAIARGTGYLQESRNVARVIRADAPMLPEERSFLRAATL
ncbi:MAG: hypothetical protein KDK99_20710 [Verrucomicrobiales bacterium]|nr:hypothetical protein [Verrucomicrobiales bacterium]